MLRTRHIALPDSDWQLYTVFCPHVFGFCSLCTCTGDVRVSVLFRDQMKEAAEPAGEFNAADDSIAEPKESPEKAYELSTNTFTRIY